MLGYFQPSKPLYEPKPYGDCKLPITPAADPDIDRNSGLRFGKNVFISHHCPGFSYLTRQKRTVGIQILDPSCIQMVKKCLIDTNCLGVQLHIPNEYETDLSHPYTKADLQSPNASCNQINAIVP